jgi:integrase
MKGCRPLTDQEADAIAESFGGPFAARDRAVFALGRYTGERISAILALRIGDIVQASRLTDSIIYRRATRKGKTESRTVALHPKAKKALAAWINQLSKGTILTADDFVFRSRKGGNQPISRVQYYRILKEAIQPNELTGKLGTHSMRKTFAEAMRRSFGGDIFRIQKAMGHKNINSTVQYLSFNEADIDKAIRGMS